MVTKEDENFKHIGKHITICIIKVQKKRNKITHFRDQFLFPITLITNLQHE
jgi:hypothetical protein